MSDRRETETIDRLFLELSQFTLAKTWRELALEVENEKLREALRPFAPEGFLTMDGIIVVLDVTVEDVERARAALKEGSHE
jgi:hypothetical protein